MRISDWSSDVCSSDLRSRQRAGTYRRAVRLHASRRIRLPASHRAAADTDGRRQPRQRTGGGGHRLLRNRGGARAVRSEEHTSELQSLMRISYAVFCLKKKKKTTIQ